MLQFNPANARNPSPARDAATLVCVRENHGAVEVFCVERHKSSRFLGGAIVFPGGKVDAADSDDAWVEHVTKLHPRSGETGDTEPLLRGLAIAACRESLEEAALLPLEKGLLAHDRAIALRCQLETKEASLFEFVRKEQTKLDLLALIPFARWITPPEETHRFDTRFYLMAVRNPAVGAHDERETTSSFWASPEEILSRFDRMEIGLAPPTHRTLELLAQTKTLDDAIRIAEASSVQPIAPTLRPHKDGTEDDETIALVLPGDPEHEVRERRSPGNSRYVFRKGRFVPGNPPSR